MKLLDKIHKHKTMLSYCLKCRRNTENINPKLSRTSNGKTIILSNCAICRSKKIKIYRKQKANGLMSSLGIKTPLSEIPLRQCFVLKAILLSDLIVIITAL